MNQREIIFFFSESWMDGWMVGCREMRDESEKGELLSIRELWPPAAVPAVTTSGWKAIDYTS